MRFNQPLLAAGLLLSLTTLNAEAALAPYISGGKSLVYSSVSDVTWIQDANLFKTLYDADNTLVSQIASVTPGYNDSYWGLQTIDADDFNTGDGRMSWWGAEAFVNYLNNISYGGSRQWALPSAGESGYNAGGQFGQLFYNELLGTADSNIPNTANFNNEQAYAYWSGTENASYPSYAWNFLTSHGFHGNLNSKDFQFYVWAVSPGQVAAVPEPGAVWLFGVGLLGLLGLKRRGHAG